MNELFDLELNILDSNRVRNIKTHHIRGCKDLLELMSKFNILILQIKNQLTDDELKQLKAKLYPNTDGDIPF